MSFTDTLIFCIVFGLLTLLFWRLRKKAIKKGLYIHDYKGWINTLWDVPMYLCGLLGFGLLSFLFES